MTPMFPKSISDVQYIYRTSDIYIRHPGTYIRYPGTYIQRSIYNTRLRLGLGQGYRTSDIDTGRTSDIDTGRTSDIDTGRRIYIGCPIYIYLDV